MFCLLCLENNALDGINTGSTIWQELNIADIIEQHFWPLKIHQSSTWICLPCWQVIQDFHKLYLRVEEAHVKFNMIKVEKEEVAELNLDGIEMYMDNKLQQSFTQQKIHAGPKSTTMELEKDEIIVAEIKKEPVDIETPEEIATEVKNEPVGMENYEDIATEVKNEPVGLENYEDIETEVEGEHVDLNDDYRQIVCDSYVSDCGTPDDDYQKFPKVVNKKPSISLGLNSKCKDNETFIAEHYKQMNCDICQELFTDFSDMKKHFANKHDQRGYVVCCKRKFYDRFHLVDHLRLHLNPNHFKCDYCEKTMSDRRTIKRHIMFEHLGNTDKSFQCEMCGTSFKEEYLLRIHTSIHLPEGERKLPCSDCAEIYDSFYSLLQHFKAVHQKKFFRTCYVCGKSIICSRDFEAHINKHEGRPHTMVYCDVCGLGLTTESGLKRHQKSQHPIDGKKEFPCSYCPKISPTLKAIRKHINTMHTASFDHKCEICERVFKRKSVLKEHMAAHNGTPLYSCPWCPRTFYSNGNMHAHRKRVHPKEWEEAKLQKYSEDFKPLIANSIS